MPVLRRAALVAAAASLVLLVAAPGVAFAAVPPVSASNTGSIVAAAATSPIALAVTAKPNDVVFSTDGTRAFVAHATPSAIDVIQVSTNTVINTIPLSHEPASLALSKDGTRLYAAGFSSVVFSIDTSTLLVTTITAPANVSQIALSADGTTLYSPTTTTVEVYSASTGASIASIPGGFTGGSTIAVAPGGTRVYAGSIGDNKIVAINTATNAIVATITNAGQYPTGFAFSPDGSKLYATAQLDNAVSIIDTATNTVTTTGIVTGNHPTRLAIAPNGQYLYTSNQASDSMSVIDLATNTAAAPRATGSTPVGMAISPDGTRLFLGNYTDHTVTAFDITQLSFTGQGQVGIGDDATFALKLVNGNSPIANYTGGTAKVELLNAANAVVATGTGVAPNALGTANALVSTAGLAAGTYKVRVTFTQPSGIVSATALGFVIGDPIALAATGSDVRPTAATGLVLLAAGIALTLLSRWSRPRHRVAAGPQTSR